MADEKKQPPIAVCSTCGQTWPWESQPAFNSRHSCDGKPKAKGGRTGSIGSRLKTPEDWVECKKCDATGAVNGARCARCNGDGWIECRDKPWIRDQR